MMKRGVEVEEAEEKHAAMGNGETKGKKRHKRVFEGLNIKHVNTKGEEEVSTF